MSPSYTQHRRIGDGAALPLHAGKASGKVVRPQPSPARTVVVHSRGSVVDSDISQVPGRSTTGIVVSDVDRFQRADVDNRLVEGADPEAMEGNGIDGNSSLATYVGLNHYLY